MAGDLNEMFDSAMDAGSRELAGTSPREGAVESWAQRVRRRRRVRHTLQAAVAVPVAAALGAGLWFGAGELLREAPVATPTPTPAPTAPAPSPSTPDPTATSEPTIDPTPDPTTPEAVEVPGLPPYFEAPDDVLSLAGAGWLLSVYQVGDESREGWPDEVGTVFLTSPGGEHYRLADVDAEWIEVHHWEAGEDRARVTVASDAEGLPSGHTTGWLDVLTGEVTADERSLEDADFLGFAADGSEVWHSFGTVNLVRPDGSWTEFIADGGGQTAVLNPAGTHIAIEADDAGIVLADIDGQEGAPVDLGVAGSDCRPVGWLDDASLLAQCDEGAAQVTVLGGEPSAEALGSQLSGLYAHQGAQYVADMTLVLRYWDMAELEADPGLEACAPAAAVWRDGELIEVPAFGPHGRRSVGTMRAHDGVIYLGGEYVCSFGEEAPLEELVRFDPATGSVSTVLPIVDFGGDPANGAPAIGAVASWVVAR